MSHCFACCLGVGLLASVLGAAESVTVFAAASTTKPLSELAQAYQKQAGVTVVTSFAASSALATQIEAGAPADLFLSADARWMDVLAGKSLLAPGSRRDLLGNALVIIAPQAKAFAVQVDPAFDFSGAFAGRLALGDPSHVPIGRYTQEAFTALGWWPAIRDRVAATTDVRASLRLVETGEVDSGVVYRSDAVSSTAVTVLATIPDRWLTSPIRYPVALLRTASPAASGFLAYLTGPEGQRVFTAHGFTWVAVARKQP